MELEPYLMFNGNCEEAFTFYKSVLGGDFTSFIRYNEMVEGNLMPEEEQDKILFIALPVGEGARLMGNDTTEELPVQRGQNMALSISLDSLEEDKVKLIFEQLSEGGEVLMPFQKTYWADWYGMCRDKFGVQWRINYRVTEYI